MGTTLKELRRKVLMGFDNVDGQLILMAEEAINQACHAIAEVHDFDDLLVTDTTSAKTVASQKRYHWVTDWLLTRPKEILSIKLMDAFNSRKLDSIATQHMDRIMPYPEGYTTGKSEAYNRQGDYIELLRIPDAAYDLAIRYYQWPLVLTSDTHECSFTNIDTSVIALARDIFLALKGMQPLDSIAKARAYLQTAIADDNISPDAMPIARGFQSGGKTKYTGEYWNNPFIRSVR